MGSGKGGVGKSTSATCLAIALQRAGCKVGLLDADVLRDPVFPHMTGVRGQVTKVDDKIGPLDFNGMPVISIGFMVPPDQAVIWRGPMLHSAVTTFVRDVAWGNLDYLIIDMPPGTGDVALSLFSTITYHWSRHCLHSTGSCPDRLQSKQLPCSKRLIFRSLA